MPHQLASALLREAERRERMVDKARTPKKRLEHANAGVELRARARQIESAVRELNLSKDVK